MSNGLADLPEVSPLLDPALEPDTSAWPPVSGPVPEIAAAQLEAEPRGLPSQVTRHVLSGTSALGASVFVERGTGLLANIIAARLGGASTFGAYSLAISTANQISTYASGGMGATAARFSGKYGRESAGYTTLRRALTIVSLVSAALAALGLWLGAAPIAHLLGRANLTGLLRWAAISSVGIILLECARGFFVGQRHLLALLTMSVLVGVGMITLLPLLAHQHNPQAMVVAQGMVAILAVLICVLLGRRLGVRTSDQERGALPLAPMLREVWSFGAIQLVSLIGSNLSGWWLTTVVARNDTSLVQISFLTIASQLRNLVGLGPSLLTEGSYAVMADPRHEQSQTPQRIMALCSYASLSVSLLLGIFGMTAIPWALTLLYGRAYAGAGTTIALALATAVAHMGTAPAAARLTIVSLRATAVINTVWAVFVAVAATLLLVRGGSAWQAMAVYFLAHLISSVLVLLTLRRKDTLPAGMLLLFALCMASVMGASALALWRSADPALTTVITASMAGILAVSATALFFLGKRHDWLPRRDVFIRLLSKLGPGLRQMTGRLRRV